MELDQLNKNIDSKEIEIEEIKSNFNHEFNKINNKKDNYQNSFKHYEELLNKYGNMTKSYEENEIFINKKVKDYENIIEELEKNTLSFRNLYSELEVDFNTKENLLKRENEISSRLFNIQKNIDNLINIKEKYYEEIQILDTNCKRLESDIFAIDMRIPNLDEEKKGYVTLKNFKEAGRISNELKQLNDNRIICVEKIKENKQMVEELKEKIEIVKLIYIYYNLFII
jgi:chromosome segregation ATPase